MGRRHGVIGNRHGSPLHFLELEPPIIELLLLLGPAPAASRCSPRSAAPHLWWAAWRRDSARGGVFL